MIRLEVMCNRYGYNSPLHRLVEIFEQLDLPFHWPEARPNLAPVEEINPTDPAPVVRAHEAGCASTSCAGAFRRRGQRPAR